MSSIGKIRRLLQILEYLQSGNRYHAGELSEFVGVSKRTIFRDLKVLQDSGVQLLYDETGLGYWIPPTSYLPPTDLTANETFSLLLLGEKLGRPKTGIPFHSSARDAAIKLMGNLQPPLRNHLSDLSEHLHISLEPTLVPTNTDIHYQLIIQSIEKRRKIRINYKTLPEQHQLCTLFSPYQVLFKYRCWYVIGRSSLHKCVQIFQINRILQSTLTDDEYKIPPRFSLNRYFGNAWQTLRESPDVEVAIRFDKTVAQEVAEVLWHPTQRLVWNDDGSLDFQVKVAGIREISRWILGYGDQAEVLTPKSLRELILSRIKKMTSKYIGDGESTEPPANSASKSKRPSTRDRERR